MSLCADCIKGVRHEGTPEGKWEKIGDVDCYVATPAGLDRSTKVLLFLTDGFGPQLLNNQLLADDFARNGFKTVMPDYFSGDGIPESAFAPEAEKRTPFDGAGWFSKHGPSQTRPLIDNVIASLRSQEFTTFAATGYCFGGRYTFDLAFEHIISVAAVSHPSFLVSPDDLEKYSAVAKAPLLINSCTVDHQFPQEAQIKADEILGEGKFTPGYKRVHWDGCTHGFAVRGDLSDPKVKAGKEGAFKSTVEWLLKYF